MHADTGTHPTSDPLEENEPQVERVEPKTYLIAVSVALQQFIRDGVFLPPSLCASPHTPTLKRATAAGGIGRGGRRLGCFKPVW